MSNAKPWQIVVIVAACILVVGSLVYALTTGGPSVKTADQITLADVTTGQLWVASVKNRGIGIPAVNPDTGKQALVSVHQDEEGRWIAGSRGLQAIKNLGITPTAVDAKTGQVQVTGDSPKRFK